ncbi:MAG TPA: cyclopropane-fatty-acyl-phospholipid synthase family protein, partial [Burkholderiaceae bacterium]
FYARWLDASMLYSSALYDGAAHDSLEAAQARRLERIVTMLGVQPGDAVLEIGCGWGTLAATLAKNCEAQVTGVTLSTEQLAFARQRASDWGVAERVDLRLQDYRDVPGRFDRIVSIEMIEAVGEAYWPTYFSTLRERLKPGGVAVLQAITIADRYFESYRRGADFIQRCIFPGGMLPSPAVLREQAERAGFEIEETQLFGPSYALTLAEWRRRFLAEWPQIEPLGFDAAFKRLWSYYLSYCEAGFRAGRVDVGLYRLRQKS